jgi:exosortase H (IPTLxxWG-CTERM-specific)
VLVFLGGLLVGGYAYAFLTVTFHDDLAWIMELTAAMSGALASVFSGDVAWTGRFVSYRGFNLEIIDECTGLFEMVIYAVAVLAFPSPIRGKLIGLAAGLPLIYLFNVARIFVLLLAGAHSYGLFTLLHLYLWQVILVLLIAGIWLLWLRLVVFRDKQRTVAVPE